MQGPQLKGVAFINKSLLNLALVISRLSQNSQHVPYRDSKLTHVLQPCLCGQARTTIIANINPSTNYQTETNMVLDFVSQAKQIKAKVTGMTGR